MFKIAIAILTLLAILVDWYIYRRGLRRGRTGSWWRIGYPIYAVAVDFVMVAALLLFRVASDGHSSWPMHAVMWIMGIFFLNAAPKALYALVSLGDYLVQRFTRRTSRIFGYVGTLLGILVAACMLYGLTYGRSRIVVHEIDLICSKLPSSFDGMRVVQFSDPHIGTLIRRDRTLKRMVRAINDLQPDLVICSGDLVNTHAWELDSAAMEILKGIRAKYGIYSVLGNHDLGIYIRDTIRYPMWANVEELVRLQRGMGWNVLVNRSEYLTNGVDSIVVSGLNYPIGYRHNGHVSHMAGADIAGTYRDIPDTLFNLTISHAPQLWDELLAAGKGDLTLAGHVHAMQMKFRIGDWRWSPARLMYDRWSGLYEEEGRYLYINDGFGYVMYPMRIGTNPEITLFVLHSEK